jgi:hypothetical protein
MIKFSPCRAICAGLVVMGLSAPVFAAQPPGVGLGQTWPNTPDVSSSPHWHVYLFAVNGVRYIQVNDLDGNVRSAFATAGGQFLVLPMGRDALRVSTPQQPLALSGALVPLNSYAETVYRNGGIQLTAVPLSNGATMFNASATMSAAASPCDDPAECNTHVVSTGQ